MKKDSKNTEMLHSRLIQRLLRPRHTKINGVSIDNLFSFGGGFINGGMSKEGMDAVRDIFSFDYMGAAEFEFGAVPEALSKMATLHKDLIAFTVDVETKKENLYPNEEKRLYGEPIKATIYAICEKSQKEEVGKRIKLFARTPYGHDTKEVILLNQTIRRKPEASKLHDDYVGWLELNNAFMFFSDKETWENVCKLFDVKA